LPTFLALSGFNGIGQRNPSPEITSEENLEYAEEFLKVSKQKFFPKILL